MVATKLMTAEEFATLPDDGWHYELIDGVVERMPAGGYRHGDVGSRTLVALWTHVVPKKLGHVVGNETGFLFNRDPDLVRVPDVAFVSADRMPPPEQRVGYLPVVPDLVVEVISPTDEPAKIQAKIEFYRQTGVRLQWWLDPEARTVTIHRPAGDPIAIGVGAVLEGEDVVPGFRLPVADIFEL